jgi:general secretion pathway protein N
VTIRIPAIVSTCLVTLGQAGMVAAVPGTETGRVTATIDRSGNPVGRAPVQELSATSERPIFSPQRRPPQLRVAKQDQSPAAAKPEQIRPGTPHLTLLGTVTSSDGARGIGVFRDETEKRMMHLRLGEQHNGWVVRQVKRASVTLERAAESVVLMLEQDFMPSALTSLPAAPPQAVAREPSAASQVKAAASMPVAAFDWTAILKQGESGSGH